MSELEAKDHGEPMREDSMDLACLKDDPNDEEDASNSLDNDKKQLLLDASKDNDEFNQADSNANDEFSRAIDVLAAETADPPFSPLSKKHGRPDSPTPVVHLPQPQQQQQQHNQTQSTAPPGPASCELQQPLAGGLMLIHDGPPLDVIPGGIAWPDGWRQRIVFRKTGGRKGPRKDSYFYTPINGYELLGIKKARLFLAKLKECDGDEEKALEIMAAPVV
jgi:hypothetical protein